LRKDGDGGLREASGRACEVLPVVEAADGEVPGLPDVDPLTLLVGDDDGALDLDGVGNGRLGDEVLHVVEAVLAQHDLHGHRVVEDGGLAVGLGPLDVLAAGVLGRHPDVEDAGPVEDVVGEGADAVLVALGRGQGEGGAVGTAAGGLDDDGLALEPFAADLVPVLELGSDLFLHDLADLHADAVGDLSQCPGQADLRVGSVETVEEPLGRGVGLHGPLGPQVCVVLVEHVDERAPLEAVDEGAGRSLVEDVVLPALGQLVVDAVHEVDVGVVVELNRLAHMEIVLADLVAEAVEVLSHLRFPRGRQGQKQNGVEKLVHVFPP
jgi:hypothetical protein